MSIRTSLSALLFILLITSCKVYHKATTENEQLAILATSDIDADPDFETMIAPYKTQLDAKMNEVIGQSEKELVKALPESTLGNWTSDAILEQCNKIYPDNPLDFAFVNYGGIRIPSIPEGDITVGKVFELMPFDNMMVVLEIKGDIVQQLFENVAGRGGWPMSSGIRCTITEDGKLKDLSIGGEPLDVNKTYRLGMSDYIANGGDQCDFFKGIDQIETGVLFRDAFIRQIKEMNAAGKKVDANIEGRMTIQ